MKMKRQRFQQNLTRHFHEDMENFEVREYGAGAPPSINFILFKFISEMIYYFYCNVFDREWYDICN